MTQPNTPRDEWAHLLFIALTSIVHEFLCGGGCYHGSVAVVGVRELRQRTDALLRRVEAGETIQIADSGRPIAVLAPVLELVPIPDGSAADPLEALNAAGEVRQATTRFADLPEPLLPLSGVPSPSATLAAMRSSGR